MESFKPKTEPKNPNLSSSYTEAVLASSRNATSTLRSQHNRKKQEIYAKQELIERRKLLQNEMRQIEMRENHPAWQKLRHGNVDHSNIQAKKLQRILEARDESREYKLELEKMMMRVQNQPTLFERQSAVSFSVLQLCNQVSQVLSILVQILNLCSGVKPNYFKKQRSSSSLLLT